MIQVNRYWENLEVLQENREAPRAYYIPYRDEATADLVKRGDEELNKRFFPYGPGFYGPVNRGGAILPLVLYNLLAITLLT